MHHTTQAAFVAARDAHRVRLRSRPDTVGSTVIGRDAGSDIEQHTDLVTLVAKAVSRPPPMRKRKVAAIRARIRSGDYDPQPRLIAACMIRGRR
ncbi:MAG: flagellar biosynthesis anti-sigma factor FlgM [Armatimonadota bacterium]